MSKQNGTGRRRRKPKTAGQHNTAIPGHSQSSSLPADRNVVGPAVALVIVCAAATTVFSAKPLSQTDERGPGVMAPSSQTQGPVELPAHRPLATADEVAALKEAEAAVVQQLVKDFPESSNSLRIMGNLCFRHGDASEALKYWKSSLRMNPKQADVCASMGWALLKKGDFAESITQYRKALEIEPQRPEMQANIGRALMMSGRHNEAIEALREEIQISPDSAFAYFLLGQVYQQQKDYEKAKDSYEIAIKIEPRYTNAYYGLATVCAKLGQSDRAKEHSATFRKLKAEGRKNLKGRKIEYDDFSETQKRAAITYINAGRMYRDHRKLDKAEELLKHGAGLDPRNVVCFMELSSLYQAKRQPAKTLQMQKRIVEIQPTFRPGYLLIGILSAHLKQFGDAEKAFAKVITLAPQDSTGYRELARLYLKTRSKLPLARKLADKALALEAIAANYFVVGWACYENADITGAFKAVRRAMELDPDNRQYPLLYKQIQQRKR